MIIIVDSIKNVKTDFKRLLLYNFSDIKHIWLKSIFLIKRERYLAWIDLINT